MRISNPLEMNDWGIWKFLGVILAIHAVMWVVVLDAFGVYVPAISETPFIRELFGFLYLTFIPGIIILRILRLHKLGSIKTLLYSVGLSVALVMFCGLLLNTIGPAIGIPSPLSLPPLIIAFSIITLVLCALSYIRDKDFSEPSYIEVREILSPPALFLMLLPLLSIGGALVMNLYRSNILLLGLMAIIAVAVALIVFNKIGKEFYPLAIGMIALALGYHFQLSFSYLAGSDIQGELYVFGLTAANSHWAPTVGWIASYSDMLSITILPTAYSSLLGMDGIGVFKLIYPFLFALVPLGLYEVFQRQTEEKTAFLAAFFFMSFAPCLATLNYLTKLQVAEFFFVLLIMLLLSKELNLTKRVALFIIFVFSMVVSHYGLSYYFMFYLLLAWLFTIFIKWAAKQEDRGEMVTATLITLCFVATISWYMYISNAAILRGAVGIGEYIWVNISDILDPGARDLRLLQGLGLAPVGMIEHSLLREVAGWLYRITYLMIIIGVLRWIVKRREMRFAPEFIGLALAGMLTMLACLVIPYFSYGPMMETNRTFQIALLLLAPFCILGGETIFAGIKRLFRQREAGAIQKSRAHLYIALLVLIPYFLFNSGFIFEVAGDPPNSLPLGQERYRTSSNEMVKAGFYGVTWTDEEVTCIRWLAKHRDENAKIYGDRRARDELATAYGLIDRESTVLLRPYTELDEGAYVYLRSLNVTEGQLALVHPRPILGAGTWMILYDVDAILPTLEENNRIYSNGGSEIYYTR